MDKIQIAGRACGVMIFMTAFLAGCAGLGQSDNFPAGAPTPPAAPAPLPEPPPAPPQPVAGGKLTFATDAFFDQDSVALRSEGKAKIDDLVSKIKDVNLEVIIAVGHTDGVVGTKEYNQKLSVRRAEAVKAYLIARGFEKNQVYTEGKGATQPIADNRTSEGRARNNRVEVEVVANQEKKDPRKTWTPNDTIPVLFATNRKRTGSDNAYYYFGNKLVDEPDGSNLTRGIAVIKVPPDRKPGEVKRPEMFHVILEVGTRHPLASAIGIPKFEAADTLTEFSYVQKIEELTAEDFGVALRRAVNAANGKSAVLYVHGFDNDFTDAAFRTAQIAYDLARPGYDLVPLMFSWPSDLGILGYDEARKRSEASGYDLAQFLREITTNSEIGTIHIIAHSMGAEVLGHAILKLGVPDMGVVLADKTERPIFRQIVFAAPDITPRIFREVIEPAIRTNHVITTYGSTTDLALWLSTMKNKNARVGRVSVNERLTACVDTVDVTAVAPRGLAHSTWAESPRVLDDIRLLFRDSLEPSERGLTRRRMLERTIWIMPANAPGTATKVPTPSAPPCRLRFAHE